MLLRTSFYAPLPLALALATVATCTLSEVAGAATFNFSYTSSLGTITATVNGTLQPDNNQVFVSSLSDLTFNGTPRPALPFVAPYSSFFGSGLTNAVLTLNGSGLDFVGCLDSSCDADGFGFVPPGPFGNPNTAFVSVGAYGDTGRPEAYNAANYSLTPASSPSVPEPSAVVGLALVGGGFLWGKLKKAA